MKLDNARILAELYLDKYRSQLPGWRFEFDRAERRFGLCNHRRKVISLSRHTVLLNDEKHVEDTILHEIAHALVGPIKRPHGPEWQHVASQLGATPRASCNKGKVPRPAERRGPNRLWLSECANCGFSRYVKKRRSVSCGRCSGGKFDERFKIAYRHPPPILASMSGTIEHIRYSTGNDWGAITIFGEFDEPGYYESIVHKVPPGFKSPYFVYETVQAGDVLAEYESPGSYPDPGERIDD